MTEIEGNRTTCCNELTAGSKSKLKGRISHCASWKKAKRRMMDGQKLRNMVDQIFVDCVCLIDAFPVEDPRDTVRNTINRSRKSLQNVAPASVCARRISQPRSRAISDKKDEKRLQQEADSIHKPWQCCCDYRQNRIIDHCCQHHLQFLFSFQLNSLRSTTLSFVLQTS